VTPVGTRPGAAQAGERYVRPSQVQLVAATSLLAATFALSLPAARSHADPIAKIHDVQGNSAATPIPGVSVAVDGVVVGDFQASSQLTGFFLQEEDVDVDADPNTSEGIFISCGAWQIDRITRASSRIDPDARRARPNAHGNGDRRR
jgi:predicted extracellular nuclease